MYRRFERIARKVTNAQQRIRIQIILRYSRGFGATTIARELGIAPSTAVKVARRFLQMGPAAFGDARCDNGIAKVDADLLQALVEILGSNGPQEYGWKRPTWTRELLIEALVRKADVRVSRTTMSRMLQSIGVKWKTAKPVVRCPWNKRRKEQRIANIQAVLDALTPEDVAFYEDEVDIHLNPKVGRDWIPIGKAREVVTPGRNKKHYMAGALSTDGRHLVYVTASKKRSALFVKLLEKLKRKFSWARHIHLILDNYSIHSSGVVRKYLAENLELFRLHFLPPYSPQYNRIERIWWDLHANVTRNHRCANMQTLKKHVHSYMQSEVRRRLRRKQQLRSLPAA